MTTGEFYRNFKAGLLVFGFLAIAIAAPAILSRKAIPAEASQAATRIEADDKDGVIRFIVKGQLKAVLDETGLYVREDVTFGGTLTDAGTKFFDDQAAKLREGADAE